jgi:hypothetical protein
MSLSDSIMSVVPDRFKKNVGGMSRQDIFNTLIGKPLAAAKNFNWSGHDATDPHSVFYPVIDTKGIIVDIISKNALNRGSTSLYFSYKVRWSYILDACMKVDPEPMKIDSEQNAWKGALALWGYLATHEPDKGDLASGFYTGIKRDALEAVGLDFKMRCGCPFCEYYNAGNHGGCMACPISKGKSCGCLNKDNYAYDDWMHKPSRENAKKFYDQLVTLHEVREALGMKPKKQNVGQKRHGEIEKELFGKPLAEADKYDWSDCDGKNNPYHTWFPVVDSKGVVVDIIPKNRVDGDKLTTYYGFKVEWSDKFGAYKKEEPKPKPNIGTMPWTDIEKEVFGKSIDVAKNYDWSDVYGKNDPYTTWFPVIDASGIIVDIISKADADKPEKLSNRKHLVVEKSCIYDAYKVVNAKKRRIGDMNNQEFKERVYGKPVSEAAKYDWSGSSCSPDKWYPVVNKDNRIIDVISPKPGEPESRLRSLDDNYEVVYDSSLKAYRALRKMEMFK